MSTMPPRRNPKKRVQQAGTKASQEKKAGDRAARRQRNRNAKRLASKIDPEIVMHASGASGTDVRAPSREAKIAGGSSIAVSTVDPSMDVQIRITKRALAYAAAGIVIRAVQRGWQASSKSAIPFYAFRYLLGSLENSVQGTFPTLQSAPLWFWELNAALLPKTERFKTGRISYDGFNLDDGAGVDVNMALGTGATYAYSIFWGNSVGATPTINGYSPLQAPAAYTEDAGMESIQSLFSYFGEEGMCKRSGAPDPSRLMMTHDTSAFAAVYPEMGASYFSPGGQATTLQSERRIHSPLMAKFAIYQDDDSLWRGYHEYHRGTGTPFYITPRLSELMSPIQLRNKVSPIFKFFDFDEFFERLSLILCLAIEQNFKGTGTLAVPCPLTSQQVQIMLRQAMLPFFNNEMAQDLRLEEPAWVPFLPFVVGPNGCSQGNVGNGPLLPFFFAENVRCCKRITAVLKQRFPGGKQGPNNMEIDIVPILGRPSYAIIPPLENYTFDQGGPASLYTVNALEVPISLIDASAVVGMTTSYLDLNGSTQPLLVQTWNDWIQQYSGTLTSLTQLSQDKGCEALNVLPYTNHLRLLSPETLGPTSPELQKTTSTSKTTSENVKGEKKAVRKESIKHIGLSLEHLRKKVGAAPAPGASEQFLHVAIAGTSATLGFTTEIWKYLSTWILPIAFTTVPIFESSTPCYMTNVIEPQYLASSSSNTAFTATDGQTIYPLLYDKHLMAASMDIRAYNSPVKSEMEIEFASLTEHGHGGFFTKIAGVIGEAFGIKGSGQFMDSVGSLTGL